MKEKEKSIILDEVFKIFNEFPLKYGEVASLYGFLRELGNKKYHEISGIGMYFSHILKKYATEDYSKWDHENEEYPTILYTDLLTSRNNKERDLVKRKVETILFKDIVIPEWKENKKWYSEENYQNSLRYLIRGLWGTRSPFYWLGEKYLEATKYANISFEELIKGKPAKKYFDLGYLQ